MWLLTTLALAGPTDRYPWVAPVDLPPTGVHRIRVPPELLPAWSADGTGMRLVDVDGTTVPFATVSTDTNPTRISAQRGTVGTVGPLGYWPSVDGDGWEVQVSERPLDGLEVLLPRTRLATTLELYEWDGQGWSSLGQHVVWRLDGSEVSSPLPMPPRLGRFKIVLDPEVVPADDPPGLVGVRYAHTQVPLQTVTLDIASTQVPETGWVRYDVVLPQAMAPVWVDVQTPEELFSRRAVAEFVEPWEAPDVLPSPYIPYTQDTLQRTRLGGARIDQVRLEPQGTPTRRLAVFVEADGAAPLAVTGVTLGVRGLDLLVRDPGTGPFSLYAGAPVGTSPPSDLQFVAPELARLAEDVLAPDARSANPDYVPPEARGGLDAPSTPIDLDRFTERRAVQSSPGLVRIPLPDDVLAAARPDLGDLRLIDAEGRQIPYILQDDGTLHTWGALPFERTERGGRSFLEVEMPQPNVMVGVVTLSTDAPLFDRSIALSRPATGRLQTLRAFRWRGDDRPTTVSLALNQRVGRTLVVEIDNGDDPPLPIRAIEAAWPGWEVVAVVPEGGAWLVLGDPRLSAPDHDLWLLREELGQRASEVATLGPPEALAPTPLSLMDRGLVAFGVGVMALGLLGLTVVLVRGAPERRSPGDDERTEPPEPDGSDPELAETA
ncbi:MAG: hypothetical protein R3F61_24140 [Myxococcota bacterium]